MENTHSGIYTRLDVNKKQPPSLYLSIDLSLSFSFSPFLSISPYLKSAARNPDDVIHGMQKMK